MAWAVVLGSGWLYLAMAHLVRKIVGNTWREFFAAQLPGIILSIVVGAVQVVSVGLLSGTTLPVPLQLALLVLVSAITGLAALVWLPASLLGPMPGWLWTHLSPKLPARWRARLS